MVLKLEAKTWNLIRLQIAAIIRDLLPFQILIIQIESPELTQTVLQLKVFIDLILSY
jgi:hypothetical protein